MESPQAEREPSAEVEADPAGTHGVGSSPRRREDPALITGEADYTDDLSDPEAVHAAVLRSRYGHARVEGIDTSAAEARDDVHAVYTAADLAEDDAPGAVSISGNLPAQKGTEFPLLAGDRVRYAGEAVAVVVAEDRYAAYDAVEDVAVDYERLDAVTDVEGSLDEDAIPIHGEYEDNLAFDWEWGDHGATDEAFDAADRTVELEVPNQRLVPNAMEPRAAFAEYDDDPDEPTLTVRLSTQVPHGARGRIAEFLGLPEHEVRVIAPEVGGGFGSKGSAPYHEEPLAAWCALQLERPVKWLATRTESHQTDHHGRDIHTRGELAVDEDGTIRGLRVDAEFNLGAYLVWGSTPAGNFRHLISGQYDIPAIAGRSVGAFTNTTPIAPYRGAGRPEAAFVVERLVNQAAAELGLDPAELRRRNQIPGDAFPFETAVGTVYKSGNYGRAMEKALEEVGYEEWRERQAEAREEGRYVGIGLGCFVENTGTAPGRPETGRVKLRKSGEVLAYCGTSDHGQGHDTTFSQVLADELGVDYEAVELREGDTDDLRDGVGTFGSRSAPVGASALTKAARKVREKARRLAARELEADPEDVAFEDGSFHIEGAPSRSIDIREVAERSYLAEDLPEDLEGGLDATTFYDPESLAYSFGTHVAVVEVDPRSGEIEFERYLAVDDCGVQFNPMIVEGQIHGGVAQGIGQALYEGAVYDDNGSLVTGSFQDYAMPKSSNMPELETEETVTPCPHNPTGAKGAGESGCLGAPPAVVNAVVDALRPLGVDNLSMPITSETVWQAVNDD